MNFFLFSSILIVITCSVGSMLLFRESKRNKGILIWGFVNVIATLWGIGAIIFSTTTNYNQAVIGWQLSCTAGIFAPLIHHHFVLAYLNKIHRRVLFLLYTYGMIALIYNIFFPEYFFGQLKFIFNEFYFISFFQWNNLPYFIHYVLATNILLMYSFTLLIKAYKNSANETQNRHKYMILGSSIGWLGTHGDYFSSIFNNFYPYLNILLAFFPIVITYAIIRHQLLDIKFVIKKSIVYVSLFTLISISYLSLVLISERYLSHYLQLQSTNINMIMAFFLGLLFLPIRNRLQVIIERLLFKGTHEEIEQQNIKLRQEIANSEKYRTLATLSSGLAHEIKNPLTAIKTFCEYLPQRLDDKEFLTKFSKIVGKEVDRIDDLVHQLMDYGKPTPLSVKPTNINKLIDDTVQFLNTQFLEHKINLIQSLNPQPYTLNIDPNQIRQALLNILLNAINAMPNGGELTIETRTLDSHYIMRIHDNGSGIGKKELKRIFDPFYTTNDKGNGLGLAITQSIIENHKGKIKVQSEPGAGTTFVITLPVSLL